jgi:hypothetical protein
MRKPTTTRLQQDYNKTTTNPVQQDYNKHTLSYLLLETLALRLDIIPGLTDKIFTESARARAIE